LEPSLLLFSFPKTSWCFFQLHGLWFWEHPSPVVLSMCTLHLDEEKSQDMRVWLSKMILAQHFCSVIKLVQGTGKLCTCQKRRV
jgi:hypothetical protein